MNFLKSHTGAMVVTVVVVALSLLFGFHRSATAAKAEIETAFYMGTDGSGYSIQMDLEARRATAANLLSVAERNLAQGSKSTVVLREVLQKEAWSGGPAQLYQINETLTQAADGVFLELAGVPLADMDQSYVVGFQVDLKGRMDSIQRDGYNAMADDFNATVLGVFPANLLKQVAFVDEVETFRLQ